MSSGEILRRETFAIGQAIFKAGDSPRCAYLIQSGAVEVTATREGKDVALGTLKAGDMFGEMALIDAQARSATAVAKEATTCVVITPVEFQKRLESSDPFVRSMLRSLTTKLRRASARAKGTKRAPTPTPAAAKLEAPAAANPAAAPPAGEAGTDGNQSAHAKPGAAKPADAKPTH
jgi:CRP-like cAMP-binding protein